MRKSFGFILFPQHKGYLPENSSSYKKISKLYLEFNERV
jgi:hypothetical protein